MTTRTARATMRTARRVTTRMARAMMRGRATTRAARANLAWERVAIH